MISVKEVVSKKDIKEFIDFPLKLYKDNKQFVPPLYSDEKKLFTEKNHYNKIAKSIYFNAYKDGKMVGRIQGIIQNQYNELHKEKRVRFTRFDSIDNQEVANALFSELEKWAKNEGMDTLCGPLGYSDLEREGLLIDGFDEEQTFEEQYNYSYYQRLIENYSLKKEVDWVEYELRKPKEKDEKLARVVERVLKMNNLHVVDSSKMSKKEYINKYKDKIFDCLDITYQKLYQTVPFTDDMKNGLIDQFLLIVNKKYLVTICDENDNVVSFGLCFPGIGKSLQKSHGKLTPCALVRLLRAVKNPEVVDLGLVAVMPEYQLKGVNAVILYSLLQMLEEGKVKKLETNLNLEDNTAVQSQWKRFDYRQHKKRRSFVKKI